MKGHIDSIETLGLLDGPGIRVVVFLQGCPLRCLFCQSRNMVCKRQNVNNTRRLDKTYI